MFLIRIVTEKYIINSNLHLYRAEQVHNDIMRLNNVKFITYVTMIFKCRIK